MIQNDILYEINNQINFNLPSIDDMKVIVYNDIEEYCNKIKCSILHYYDIEECKKIITEITKLTTWGDNIVDEYYMNFDIESEIDKERKNLNEKSTNLLKTNTNGITSNDCKSLLPLMKEKKSMTETFQELRSVAESNVREFSVNNIFPAFWKNNVDIIVCYYCIRCILNKMLAIIDDYQTNSNYQEYLKDLETCCNVISLQGIKWDNTTPSSLFKKLKEVGEVNLNILAQHIQNIAY